MANNTSQLSELHCRRLGLVDYLNTWQSMKDFTDNRDSSTVDEIWLVEHPPVFTQGQAGKPEHVLSHSEIPIVQTDRGGQVTYHGPGQLVMYCLFDLKRLGISVKSCVSYLEQSVIDTLQMFGVTAELKDGAPGVYVEGAKIASLGLRVRKGCTYHGLSLNVDMDLSPFLQINPCGYQGLAMTQLSDLVTNPSLQTISNKLLEQIEDKFAYQQVLEI